MHGIKLDIIFIPPLNKMNPDNYPEKELENLRERIHRIEESNNPDRLNLHFNMTVHANSSLFEELFSIGLEAWDIIKSNQSRITSYWFYNFFLLISSASQKILNDKNQKSFQKDEIVRLVLLITEISQMTTTPEYIGDMLKRNHEALGNSLLAFSNMSNLRKIVVAKAKEMGNQDVINFIEWKIERVEQVEKEREKSSTKLPEIFITLV
jgi:hypothetical protein